MMRPPPKSAVVRARWLAELTVALDEAHRLTLRLAENQPDSGEAAALRVRIQAMRSEVETLRRGNHSRTDKNDPIWAYLGDWRSVLG
ncbi:MAG: hypothetical protein ABIP07_02980 [Sphingomicrobium sp.]